MSADFDRDLTAIGVAHIDSKMFDAGKMRIQKRRTELNAQPKGAKQEGGEGQEKRLNVTKGELPPVGPRSSPALQSHSVPDKCSA